VIHGGSAGSAALALVIPWFYWASKVQTKASSMKASKGTYLYVEKKKNQPAPLTTVETRRHLYLFSPHFVIQCLEPLQAKGNCLCHSLWKMP
jgi:hypothetical protein